MNYTRLKKQAGFTLVETLVAISILSLSILGTFTAVQNGLQSSSFAKDQITAFYLVQEAMEYMRNIRDQNALASINSIAAGGPAQSWLHGIAEVAGDPCYFGNTCRIDSPQKTAVNCNGAWGSCPYLLQDTGQNGTGLYGYTTGSTSRFKREVQLTSISAHEVIITVSISWTSGAFTKTFRVSQELLDWQ